MSGEESITLKKNNSSATVHLFGATLTSWKPNGKEVIFVSKNSNFDCKKPIRGGVPVIFPCFGPWEHGPKHGFARRIKWKVKEYNTENGNSATFVLEDSSETRKMWNYKFFIEYTISVFSDTELKMDVVITNSDNKNFDFTFLLHNYFSVPNILNCKVEGLKGCLYEDKVKNETLLEEENEHITLSEFTDRIYRNSPTEHSLLNVSGDQNLEILKFKLPDTVIWNPWKENAKKMDDFGDDEWKNMICVEAGYVSNSYTLKPGHSYEATQILIVFD